MFGFKSKKKKFCCNCHRKEVDNVILLERIDRYEERLAERDVEIRVLEDKVKKLECSSLIDLYEELVECVREFMVEIEELNSKKQSEGIKTVIKLAKKYDLWHRYEN